MRVKANFYESGSVLAGTAYGRAAGLEIKVSLDSTEKPQVVKDLLRLAHQMCFTEDALRSQINIRSTHSLNGEELDDGD